MHTAYGQLQVLVDRAAAPRRRVYSDSTQLQLSRPTLVLETPPCWRQRRSSLSQRPAPPPLRRHHYHPWAWLTPHRLPPPAPAIHASSAIAHRAAGTIICATAPATRAAGAAASGASATACSATRAASASLVAATTTHACRPRRRPCRRAACRRCERPATAHGARASSPAQPALAPTHRFSMPQTVPSR